MPTVADTRDSSTPLPPLEADARLAAWWVAVGLVAGTLVGALIGGIGGRIAMLILRLATPDLPVGLVSDDGFEIGAFNLGPSLQLYSSTAFLGAINGVVYAAIRQLLPRRGRGVLWGVFSAAVGGSQFVHTDGVDFTLLEPRWFAITSFVLLPGIAAALVAALVERAAVYEPWGCPRWLALLALPGLPGLLVAPVAAAAAAAIVALGRIRVVRTAFPPLGRIVVPLVLVAGIVVGAVAVVRDAVEILG